MLSGYAAISMNYPVHIVLNGPQNPYVNHDTKKYLPNLPTQKNPGVAPPKILQLFYQFCHLIPKELPPPSGTEHSFKNIAANIKYMVHLGWGNKSQTCYM